MQSKTIELPCSIGDVAWAIRDYMGHPKAYRGIVSEMYFTDNMQLCIVVQFTARGIWGENIFATEEDALNAIKERKQRNEEDN